MAKLRSGIEVLEDIAGDGEEIQRHEFYRMSLRIWLNKGEAVVWLTGDYRVDREFLFSGLFYGIEGMRGVGK